MTFSVRPSVFIMLAIMSGFFGAFVTTTAAQEEASNPPVIHSGNTYILFENAGTAGLPSARYQAFEQFASEHPDITRALAHNPRLIESESFAGSHPALGDFLRTNPEISNDFAENPGNYVDMPLAVAASIKRHPISQQ